MRHMPVHRLIRERYAAVYGAAPAVDYPHHCTVAEGGEALATLGYRRGDEGRLFVEAYIDAPIEALVSARVGRSIDRAAIVEIGAHASRRPAATLALWVRAASELRGEAEFAVAVLTRPMRAMLERAGLTLHALAAAPRERVERGSGEWGRYYESDPLLCAGEIRAGCAALARWRGARA